MNPAARIVVVDDSPLNRQLVCDLLQIEGYEVCACADAGELMQALATRPRPDLILMDIQLPGVDGLTLTRRLRADPRHAAIPVVAVTAFAMKGDERKALDAGCRAYVSKPIDTRALPALVASLLAERAAARRALNVLIVEDRPLDLILAGDRVRLSGHVALGLVSAEQAIEALARERPDVVLLDLSLPGMDGLAFVQRVRADPQLGALPIVAVTAYPDLYARAALLAAGCSAYLVKPVSREELMAQIEAAADGAAAPDPG